MRQVSSISLGMLADELLNAIRVIKELDDADYEQLLERLHAIHAATQQAYDANDDLVFAIDPSTD